MTATPKTPLNTRRALWILSTAVVISGAGVTMRIAGSVYRRSVAAERLEELGGQVAWSESPPRWLSKFVGPTRASRLTGVTSIGLADTRVTDGDLRWIIEMPELEELYAHNNPALGDESLRYVGHVRNLQRLYIGGARITDAGMARLNRLHQLQELYLAGVPITDAGLKHLEPLTRLEWLVVDSPLVADGGLASIGRLTELKFLILCGTSVTDDGLVSLRNLTKLRTLGLSETLVTDAGLVHLAGLKDLGTLLLEYTSVTEAGIESFRAIRPDVEVVWSEAPVKRGGSGRRE
jgi:hypothetical protein